MEAIITVVIYILIPILGVIFFIRISRTFKPVEKQGLFALKLLLVFGCFAGLLVLLLTILFWKSSGLATIGTAFLLLIAPLIIGFIAYDSFTKKVNDAENRLFELSILYFIALPLVFLIALLFEK
jgi:hypothetical protein